MTDLALPTTLDVRELMPVDRHRRVFETFDALPAGAALELVNDHDPKPLYYQLQSRSPGTFTWSYRQAGPDVWRVEILRIRATPAATGGCCGACGGA